MAHDLEIMKELMDERGWTIYDNDVLRQLVQATSGQAELYVIVARLAADKLVMGEDERNWQMLTELAESKEKLAEHLAARIATGVNLPLYYTGLARAAGNSLSLSKLQADVDHHAFWVGATHSDSYEYYDVSQTRVTLVGGVIALLDIDENSLDPKLTFEPDFIEGAKQFS